MDHSSSTLSSSKIDQPHRTISMSGRDRIAVENYVSKYFEKAIGFNFNPTAKRSMMEILFNYTIYWPSCQNSYLALEILLQLKAYRNECLMQKSVL